MLFFDHLFAKYDFFKLEHLEGYFRFPLLKFVIFLSKFYKEKLFLQSLKCSQLCQMFLNMSVCFPPEHYLCAVS